MLLRLWEREGKKIYFRSESGGGWNKAVFVEEPVEDIATACSNVHGGLTFQLEIIRLSKVLMIREVGGGKRLKRIKKKIIISCNQQTYSDYVKNKKLFLHYNNFSRE